MAVLSRQCSLVIVDWPDDDDDVDDGDVLVCQARRHHFIFSKEGGTPHLPRFSLEISEADMLS